MDNRIKRLITILAICLLLVCVSACGMEPTTDDANPTPSPTATATPAPTPEPQDESIFSNIQNIKTNNSKNVAYGAYWIETLEEYNSLGMDKAYDESFFRDKALFVLKTEWTSGTPDVTLLPSPMIEDGVLCPVVNVHLDQDVVDCAMMTMVMTAEVDKEYAEMPIGQMKLSFSGSFYENGDYSHDFLCWYGRTFWEIEEVDAERLQALDYGIHWINTLDEYNSLGLDKEYSEHFFSIHSLLVVKTEWGSCTPVKTLLPDPIIEDGVLHPVINVHLDQDDVNDAMMTTVMIAWAEKEYAEMPLGELRISFSGSFYEKEENKQHNFYVEMDGNE